MIARKIYKFLGYVCIEYLGIRLLCVGLEYIQQHRNFSSESYYTVTYSRIKFVQIVIGFYRMYRIGRIPLLVLFLGYCRIQFDE